MDCSDLLRHLTHELTAKTQNNRVDFASLIGPSAEGRLLHPVPAAAKTTVWVHSNHSSSNAMKNSFRLRHSTAQHSTSDVAKASFPPPADFISPGTALGSLSDVFLWVSPACVQSRWARKRGVGRQAAPYRPLSGRKCLQPRTTGTTHHTDVTDKHLQSARSPPAAPAAVFGNGLLWRPLLPALHLDIGVGGGPQRANVREETARGRRGKRSPGALKKR